MRIDLKGRPICITGASSGIGLATAIECARAGMPVVLAARRVDRLGEAAERVRAEGGRALALACDVADADACRRMVEACVGEFGSVYAVFANAGYGVEKPIHVMSDEEMRSMFEVNFFGTMNAVRPALPHMLGAGEGHVLICSSCLAKFALPYFGAYSATKAAQNHISRAMRLELEPHGVHVSSVHPIGTRTEFHETVEKMSGGAPLMRHTPDVFVQPAERVARAVVGCLRRPRAEVWTSLFVRLGMAVSMASPALADMSVRGMVRRRMRDNGRA